MVFKLVATCWSIIYYWASWDNTIIDRKHGICVWLLIIELYAGKVKRKWFYFVSQALPGGDETTHTRKQSGFTTPFFVLSVSSALICVCFLFIVSEQNEEQDIFYIKLEQKCCQPQTANTCSGSQEMVAFAVELVSRFRWMTEYDIIIEASLTACCFSTWIVMRARNAFICSVTRQKK